MTEPEIVLTVDGKLLKNKEDYTLSYSNNKAVRKADDKKAPSVKIIGKNGYTGTITRTFTIEAKSFSDNENPVTASISDMIYFNVPGNFKNYLFALSDNGKLLIPNVDYDMNVVYSLKGKVLKDSDKVKPGDVVVATIKGKGNYTGTMSVSFKVRKISFKFF